MASFANLMASKAVAEYTEESLGNKLDEINDKVPLIPYSKCQSIISILEDSVDQLSVLDDIIPESEKNDQHNRVVRDKMELSDSGRILKVCSWRGKSIVL